MIAHHRNHDVTAQHRVQHYSTESEQDSSAVAVSNNVLFVGFYFLIIIKIITTATAIDMTHTTRTKRSIM